MGSKHGQHGIDRPLKPGDEEANLVHTLGGGDQGDRESDTLTSREIVENVAGRTEGLGDPFNDCPPINPEELADALLDTAVRHWGSPTDRLRQSHPALAEFLFSKSWDGIAPRDPGVLTIAVRPTGVNVTLKMPSEAQSLTVSCLWVSQVFDALERALRTRTGDWKELKSGPGATKLREDRKKLLATRKRKK